MWKPAFYGGWISVGVLVGEFEYIIARARKGRLIRRRWEDVEGLEKILSMIICLYRCHVSALEL